jgi:hypothetical protein
LLLQIPAGQLNAGKNELDAEYKSRERQGDGVQVFLRTSVFQRLDKVSGVWGEDDTGQERYDLIVTSVSIYVGSARSEPSCDKLSRSFNGNWIKCNEVELLTGFREVVILLEQIRNQPKPGDPSTQNTHNYIEIGDC